MSSEKKFSAIADPSATDRSGSHSSNLPGVLGADDVGLVRVKRLINEAHDTLAEAKERFIYSEGKTDAGVCVLFSGGNDSTVLTHLMKEEADWAVHINTGIGIEQTRQYVRDTCRMWGLPLMEKHPPAGSTYRELVLDQGFPGPGHHFKMYQRLKERGLRQVRKELVKHPRRERVIFLAGRRREESQRRMNVPEFDRVGSIVFVSPLVNWTKADLNTYRTMFGDAIPRNEVSDNLHMSGECLCGAFAKKGELDEIAWWYPDTAAEIHALEAEVLATGKFEEKRCKWGWGDNGDLKYEAASKSGLLCSSCDYRYQPPLFGEGASNPSPDGEPEVPASDESGQ